MSFDYTSGDPDNLVAGGPAQMTDIQGPFVDIAAYLNSAVPINQPPLVTSLPVGPVEGQEVIYKPAITRKNGASLINDGYFHMRYISGVWRYLGGTPYIAGIPGLFAVTLGGSFQTLKTRISIPAIGLWKVAASVRFSPSSTPGGALAMFSLMTGITDNAGTASGWADVGASPTFVGSGGSVVGWNAWNVSSLSVPNFETWITSPSFALPGNVEYGSIQLEPVTL